MRPVFVGVCRGGLGATATHAVNGKGRQSLGRPLPSTNTNDALVVRGFCCLWRRRCNLGQCAALVFIILDADSARDLEAVRGQ